MHVCLLTKEERFFAMYRICSPLYVTVFYYSLIAKYPGIWPGKACMNLGAPLRGQNHEQNVKEERFPHCTWQVRAPKLQLHPTNKNLGSSWLSTYYSSCLGGPTINDDVVSKCAMFVPSLPLLIIFFLCNKTYTYWGSI